MILTASETRVRDTFDEYVEDWCDALEFGQAIRSGKKAEPLTVKTYRTALHQLGAFLLARGMPRDPTVLTREHVEEWLRYLRTPKDEGGQGLSEQTALQRYRSTSRFFTWLVDEDERPDHPMVKLKAPRPENKLVPVVSDSDLRQLMAAVADKDFESRRDKAIIGLFIDTGLRLSEMAGLRVEDVDMDVLTAQVVGKGARPRLVPFVRETRQDIRRYMRMRVQHPSADLPFLWIGKRGHLTGQGIHRMLHRRCEQAGIPKIHAHQLRHTMAHLYRLNDGNDGNLMAITGWKSRAMLDRYGASVAAERARAAHENYSPRRGL